MQTWQEWKEGIRYLEARIAEEKRLGRPLTDAELDALDRRFGYTAPKTEGKAEGKPCASR